ncbi:helix-turn-helix domain-containing protein [Azospirillum sp.]|uniref:HVO_A0114 family putative DNA-binding protein n=1 Tax=Azospirillum sp. TaxID=34012 RepID=UPI002D3D75BC|nr:MarR family transcriptional regulator [Azospirillum sp.]HYD70774.1 MarR family transcriptional regulator [Azospirillum sp.]
MTAVKIIGLDRLEADMRAVARGERAAPDYAGTTTCNSVEALTRLLTPENRRLLATIRDGRPQSVADLARLTGRAPSNVTRTLDKLAAAGLVTLRTEDRRRVPALAVRRIRIEIDPCADDDRLDVA